MFTAGTLQQSDDSLARMPSFTNNFLKQQEQSGYSGVQPMHQALALIKMAYQSTATDCDTMKEEINQKFKTSKSVELRGLKIKSTSS